MSQSKNYLPVYTRSRCGAAIWKGWRSSVYILITVLTPFSKLNLACLDAKHGGKNSCFAFILNKSLFKEPKIWLTHYLGVLLALLGVCGQELSLLVITRIRAKLVDVSSDPLVVPIVPDSQGITATTGPATQQGMPVDRPSSAASIPPDEPDYSFPKPALPAMLDWKIKLIAAYAVDSWFSDDSNTSSLTLDEGLWYI